MASSGLLSLETVTRTGTRDSLSNSNRQALPSIKDSRVSEVANVYQTNVNLGSLRENGNLAGVAQSHRALQINTLQGRMRGSRNF